MTVIQRVGEIEAWVIFVLCWVFVVEHTVLSWIEWRRWGAVPWWRTVLGWMFTAAVASLGTVLGFAVAADLWPVLAMLDWYMWAYLIAVGTIAVVVGGKIAARGWLHVQARRGRTRG